MLEEREILVLVMELLNGVSLADRLLAGMLDASEVLKITQQMLQALQALHDLGIVHRDLKPSNVFLTRHGVKLLYLGPPPVNELCYFVTAGLMLAAAR